jgi:hypothetical protein
MDEVLFNLEDSEQKEASLRLFPVEQELLRENEVLKQRVEGFRKQSLEAVSLRPVSEGNAGAMELPSPIISIALRIWRFSSICSEIARRKQIRTLLASTESRGLKVVGRAWREYILSAVARRRIVDTQRRRWAKLTAGKKAA